MAMLLRRRTLGVVLLAASFVVLAGCDPVIGSVSGPVRHATLTSASGMTYHYAGGRDVVFAQPGLPGSDTNVREVFWYSDSAYAVDQESCMTWNTVAAVPSTGLMQPGVALRIAPVTADNRGIEAITVTQNIYFGAIWLFNVHVWNSLDRAHPFTQIGQFDLSGTVGSLLHDGVFAPSMVPAPWHVCARTQGSVFSFKVWTGTDPQPSWSDTSQVHSVVIPPGWNHPGYAGGYVGHLYPGQAAAFSNVSTQPVP
jgi:hypothetical protein